MPSRERGRIRRTTCSRQFRRAAGKRRLKWSPGRRPEIELAFEERIHKVLSIALLHGHAAIVLGAWGCGAFGNDSREVAPLFARALSSSFQGVFSRVVFAITDWSKERRFISPFQEAFEGAAPKSR